MIGKDIEVNDEVIKLLIKQLNERFDNLEKKLSENYLTKLECFELQKNFKEKYIDPINKKIIAFGGGFAVILFLLNKVF